jgi:hypothetical protein
MNKLSIVIPFFLILISCEDNSSRCKKEILLEDFKNIRIEDIFDILLVQDTLNKIILEGSENLLPHVKTVVQKDTLLIENSLRCNWLRDYEKVTLSVHFRELKHIVTLAPVNIISHDTLKVDTLRYFAIGEIGEADLILDCRYFRFDDSHSTLGLFKFRGKAGKSRFYVNYGSSLDAMDLVSAQSDIYQETIGDIYVNVTEHLRVWIWGPGNVYYSGNPPLVEIMENRSSGKITRID